ncbi:sugar ABC transporter substrate-binding protein [Chitiniphilus shinanonensis]|uniref:Sugar ABC transporter substrate-binding protein n=1 Tax=Chitiniphilus shinanonensis TaxID=553088 RepID=A0ABQ6BTP7_9NEIS|nr:extracellular solute-binding protein [Chitiniphilus shinanonensis]GLS05380.1 sugar ABC transporter substrate-binding protein [Chitiniphilus shinanonensis]
MSFRIVIALVLAGVALCARAAEPLTVAVYPNLDEAIRLVTPLWRQRHPDVPLKFIARNYVDHHNAMTTALAAGSGLPDVMAVEVGYLGRFAASGGLTDLAAAPYRAGRLRDRFVRYAFAQAENGGRIVAIPTDLGPGGLFYRHDIFSRAGIDEADFTASWERYLSAGRRLKAATGVFLLAHPREIKDIVLRSGLKDGEGLYFNAAGQPQVESPRFVRAFTLARAARVAGLDARLTPYSAEWSAALRTGRVASQPGGAWLVGHLEDWLSPGTDGRWRVTRLPGGTRAAWGGSFYAIPAASRNKALAWELIQLLTMDRALQLAAFKSPRLNAFPALRTAQDDPFFAQPMPFLGGQRARLFWREAAAEMPALTVHRLDPVAEEIVNAELDRVLDDGKDIATALADARRLIERRVRRP